MDFFSIIFWLLVCYVWYRVTTLDRRITRLETRERSSETQDVRTKVAQATLAQEGIHEGDMFARAIEARDSAPSRPAPLPPPIPDSSSMPMYDSATRESFSDKKIGREAPAQTQTSEETGAKWLGRVGAFAVFLGIAYFLKYAFDTDLIGESGRVAIGIVFGLGMIGVGQKLRAKYLNYSDILMAGGIGILYLSLYASYGFYHLLDVSFVFVLMGLVTLLGMVLSIAGNTRGLAIFALLGGFLTPVLLSTGENHLATLSLYLIILDLGAFGIAWFKKWVALNYVSFFGTFLLFSGWYSRFYSEAQFGETFLFVSVFFVIFLATSVLHHILRKEPTTVGDLALLVLNVMSYFGAGVALLEPSYHDVLGFFSIFLSILYLLIAYVAYDSNNSDRTLNLFLPGIATVFLTIAIPLQLSGYWISLAWLVESVLLIAVGLYLREKVITVFGWIVLFFGISAVSREVGEINMTDHQAFWNTGFFLMATAVATLYLIAWLYRKWGSGEEHEGEHLKNFALVLGSFGTAIAFTAELAPHAHHYQSISWFIEAVVVLMIGLTSRNRLVEFVGWVFAFVGLCIMTGDVSQIHNGIPSSGRSGDYDPLPFMNLGVFLMGHAILVCVAFALLYGKLSAHILDRKRIIAGLVVVANLLTIACVTSEISFVYDRDIHAKRQASVKQSEEIAKYYGSIGINSENQYAEYEQTQESIRNIENTKENAISLFWALYAVLLVAIGFVKRLRLIRLFGLVFFFVTAGRVFIQIFGSADEIGRIISTIVFGLIALGASFLYVKFKDRIIHD